MKKEILLNGLTILITGVAGFIGSNTAKKIFYKYKNVKIIGIDNLNDYYDVDIKKERLESLLINSNFIFIEGNIANKTIINEIFTKYKPDIIVNLAAQAGVRYSISHPDSYIESNVIGFYNLLEAARHSYDDNNSGIQHFIFASSSSVYGSNNKVPYSTTDKTDSPVSLYAATKKCDELMAHAYAKLYNIPLTGLRFFTVYGPAGRPDMAYLKFTNMLLNGETIEIFNNGNCKRDFTYIDDIVEGVIRVTSKAPMRKIGGDGLPVPPFSIYNIGNNKPEDLLTFIKILSNELIRTGILPETFDFDAHKKFLPMQPGDVPITYADTSEFEKDFDFKPNTSLKDGLKNFADWYKKHYV